GSIARRRSRPVRPSTSPAMSGTTPERSRTLPSASINPGFSAPAAPKRTSFMSSSLNDGLADFGCAHLRPRFTSSQRFSKIFQSLQNRRRRMEAKRAGGRTLAGDAYEAIRQAIRSGSVKPGERLRFADLQALCGMSVTPVREALARLTAEGFTVLDDHRGYSVASLSLAELRDLTAARQLCEGEALRLSVEKGDADWEGRVIAAHHLMARIPQAREDIPSAMREDWEARHAAFHAA